RGCRGLSDAGQATMLDVTEILSEKWSRLSAQTVIRCWLKADILPREHCNLLKSMDTRLDREDKDGQGFIDDLCDLVKKMSMPTSVARSANPRCMPRVLTDNLCVEQGAGLSEQDLRQAIQTWLTVEDDPNVKEDEVALELQEVEKDIAGLRVDDDVSSDEEDGNGRPESCITSSLSEAEVHSRFEELRSYLYANGTGGEYSETQHLLSKTVHSFTHETQVKRRAKPRGEVQGTLHDMWREKPSG
ncbi:unnamed protein product, partial [Ectocarpus fasciculatus]